MINTKMTTLMLAGLLSSGAFFALAADKTQQGSAVPPAALPGINQGQGTKPKPQPSSKKGEEAAGSNSGSDSQTIKKDSSSSDSDDERKASNSGS